MKDFSAPTFYSENGRHIQELYLDYDSVQKDLNACRNTPAPHNPNNQAFIHALRNGNEWAFTTLVNHYCPGMLRFSMTMISDPSIAETLVQDTWQEILKRLAAYDGRLSIKVWIFRLLHIALCRLPHVSSTLPGMKALDDDRRELSKCLTSHQGQQTITLHSLLIHGVSGFNDKSSRYATWSNLTLMKSVSFSTSINAPISPNCDGRDSQHTRELHINQPSSRHQSLHLSNAPSSQPYSNLTLLITRSCDKNMIMS